MMIQKQTAWLAALCFTVFAHAGDMGSVSRQYFISASAGPSWTNAGSSQTIASQPDDITTYVPNNLSNSTILADLELFLGVQTSFFKMTHSQFGLAFYASRAATLNGFIQVDGNPNLENYAYQYNIGHEHIALKTKWIFDNALTVNPYLSASLGIGFNHTYRYIITPLIVQELPALPFQSNTQAALSYSLGAGFQHTIGQHVIVALGYQLVSWGGSHLNPAVDQTSGKGLNLSNLYTQGIEFNMSYLL